MPKANQNTETSFLEALEAAFPDTQEVELNGFTFQLAEPEYGKVLKAQMSLERDNKKIKAPEYGTRQFNRLPEERQKEVMEQKHDVFWNYIVNLIRLCVVTAKTPDGKKVPFATVPDKMLLRMCKQTGGDDSPLVQEVQTLCGVNQTGSKLSEADDPFLSQKSTDGNPKKS